MEKIRAERTAKDQERRESDNAKLMEEASAPAFLTEIDTCRNIVDFFSRGNKNGPIPAAASTNGSANPALPQLNLRTVDAETDMPTGATAMKKKTDDDVAFFVGKTKAKKGRSKAANEEKKDAGSQSLNIPFSTLSALLEFGIPAPTSSADIPSTVEALNKKREWFQENQVCRRPFSSYH